MSDFDSKEKDKAQAETTKKSSELMQVYNDSKKNYHK